MLTRARPFFMVFGPKKKQASKSGRSAVCQRKTRAKRMLMGFSIFYASKQISFFIGKGVVVILIEPRKRMRHKGPRPGLILQQSVVPRVRTFMKIERVVKHFIRLKGQGQGEPQGVQEGATHPVAPAAQSKRKKGVATSCFLSIIEIAILPFDDLTRGT